MKKKKTTTMEKKRPRKLDASKYSAHIGRYALGDEWVDLYLVPDSSGEFSIAPADQSGPFIAIGHACGRDWVHTHAVLLHEAMEFAMTRIGCRFLPCPINSRSHAAYIFQMTHEQFAEAAERAGQFIAASWEDLKRHFDNVRYIQERGKAPAGLKVKFNEDRFRLDRKSP